VSKIYVDEILPKDNATVDGSKLSALPTSGMPTGSVLQVVTRTFNTNSTTTATSMTDTDCYVDITPTSASSKILITGSFIGQSQTTGTSAYFKLFRDSTALTVLHRYEDALLFNVSPHELDSPSSTSSIRYMVKIQAQSGNTVGVNTGSVYGRMTAMEIAG